MISSWLYPQNRYIQRCRQENNEKNLKGKHVLVVGGTQGIGAAVARRFATLQCKVSIAGRSEARAKSVLWDLNLANPGPFGKFYKVDLSSMKEVERFTDEVIQDVQGKGIDYLVLSAGGPATGIWRQSSEVSPQFEQAAERVGIGESFCGAVFGKESVVIVGSPGFGAFYDESDPGFEKPENRKKMTMVRQGRRDCLYLDAIFKEFSIRNPRITFHHIFPGIVYTNSLENQGFNPIIVTLGRFVGGLVATDPDVYSDVPVCKAIGSGEKGGLYMTGVWGWKVAMEKWAQDDEKRRALFEWSLKKAQAAARQGQNEVQGI